MSTHIAEKFAGLLLRHRGRTRLTQRQLAARIGVHMRSIQCWESGINYPCARSLQALIEVFLQQGALTADRLAADAEELWAAAQLEAPRVLPPFDSVWFDDLVASAESDQHGGSDATAAAPTATPSAIVQVTAVAHREHWADAPDVSRSVGRTQELDMLRQLVRDEQCRMVQILGMGGIGKTMLATRVARDMAREFDLVYWSSVRGAPSASEWLAQAIAFLSDADVPAPACEEDRITVLVRLLRERRCLLVLDNLESLLEPCDCEGRFREAFNGYQRLLQAVSERWHQSCMIVTSREASAELALVGGGSVRSVEVSGLSVAESQEVLRDKELLGTELDWADFVTRCGGNALLMKLTGETMREVFGGNIDEFLLHVGSNSTIHGGVRRLLASQLEQRLSLIEQDVLRWLASTPGQITPAMLMTHFESRVSRGAVIEALQGLRRRSLLEPSQAGTGLRLHPVARDYIVGQLADEGLRASANF